jgi:hypothetical protein
MPAALATLTLRCLARSPRDRPTARQVAIELAAPPAPPGASRAWIAAVVAGAAVAIVGGGLVAAAMALGWFHARPKAVASTADTSDPDAGWVATPDPGTPPPSGWQRFTAADYGFSAAFPDAPKKEKLTPSSKLVSSATRFSAATPGASFAVVASRLGITIGEGSDDAQALLDGARDAIVKNGAGSERRFTFLGHAARDIRGTWAEEGGPRFAVRMRAIATRTTVYTLVVMRLEGDDHDPADDERFVASFTLTSGSL